MKTNILALLEDKLEEWSNEIGELDEAPDLYWTPQTIKQLAHAVEIVIDAMESERIYIRDDL